MDFKVEKNKITACLLAAVLLLSVAGMFYLQKKYNYELKALKEKLAIISNAKSTFQEALRKAIRKNKDYQAWLQQEIEKGRALSNKIDEISLEISSKESQLLALNSEAKNLKDENSAIKGKINQLNQEKFFLNERVIALQKKIKRLLTRTKVELGELVIKPSALNGKVLKLNRKYNFVIIDLGKNDGVQAGMSLVAYRQDSPIGEIKIEKVYDELSVGRAAFEWRDNELDVGDAVRGKD